MSKPLTHLCHVCGNGIPHDANSAGKLVSCPYCAAETELGKTYPPSAAGYTNPWDQAQVTSPIPVLPVQVPSIGGLAIGNAMTSVGGPPPLPKKMKIGPWGSMSGIVMGLGLGGLAAIGILVLGFFVIVHGTDPLAKALLPDSGTFGVGTLVVAELFIVLFVAGAAGVAIFKFFFVVGVGTDMARSLEDNKIADQLNSRPAGQKNSRIVGQEIRKNVGLAGSGFCAAVAAGFLIYKQVFVSFAFMMVCVGGLLGLAQWFLNIRTFRTPEGVFCLFVVSANLLLCFLSR